MRFGPVSGLLALVLLAGCGGGGGDGPPVAVGTNGVPELADAIANGRGFIAPAQRSVADRSSVVWIERDMSVRIRVAGDVVHTFGEPVTTVSNIETYQSADGRDVLIKNATGLGFGDRFDLNHTSFGVWAESRGADLLQAETADLIDGAPFYLVVPTPRSEMPTTGAALYRGAVLGVETDGREFQAFIVGALDAEVDFLRGTMSATATLSERDGTGWGTVDMPGILISGTAFSSDAVTASSGHRGTVEGVFAGPKAVELAGTLILEGETTVRASIAARQR